MMRKFKFDYDPENDNLFLYDPNSKSKASIEIDDLIIDYNSDKEVSGIEILKASSFLKEISSEMPVSLNDVQDCKVEIITKSNFFVIKFMLVFKSKKTLTTPVIVPIINESSPSLAY